MKKISQEELDNLLDNHELWLKNPSNDKNRLNLENYDLSFLEIKNRDLSKALFDKCNMFDMKIQNCDLSYTGLYNSKMNGIMFYVCNLNETKIYSIDLSEGLFTNCTLTNIKLIDTNLAKAEIRNCKLTNIKLIDTNLSGAEIRNCKLDNIVANPFTSFYNLQCPEEGSFIGFKKAYINITPNNKPIFIPSRGGNKTNFPILPVIVKLQITEDSLRSSSTSRKCRCSKAKVLSISYLDGTECPEDTIALSQHDNDFVYKVGEILEIKDFKKDRWKECATGIHFFITREEAVNY